ncbi:hypothetical protein OG264_06005 [Streptomyces xanthophaeus]|nr:hypothetical protein OG264_06005 [Streptomyces xanthophaeus]WST65500.1 hypothetical protein OG605_32355 [Streptomyces xanthophaeus]
MTLEPPPAAELPPQAVRARDSGTRAASSVDFPQPLRPSSTVNSPARSVRSSPSMTARPPKDRVSPATRTAVSGTVAVAVVVTAP